MTQPDGYTISWGDAVAIASAVYRQWQKEMPPPLLIYYSFSDWLALQAQKSQQKDRSE